MGLVMVTRGYTYIAILILALWMATRTKMRLNPFVALNFERALVIALGLGIALIGLTVWADLFPPTMPGFVPDYMGL